MADKQRSMMTSLPAVATMLLGIALLVLAALRWRENGWGSLVWLLVMVAMFVIRTPHSLRNRANVVVDARKDGMEIALLAGMFLAMMVLPLLYLALGLFRFADYDMPEWATWIGALAQIPYLWLFWRSHADLGRNWSPGLEVREDHALVTNGVYGRIRNPMYAAIWISALAQPLLIHNWIAGFFVVPAFAAMWFIRVPNEEAMMRARFGAAWDAYCARAGRLFPKRR
ncbi:MAG: protein-S-isoprenylcysteine O-methyltransferase [Sphingomonas bacterium]